MAMYFNTKSETFGPNSLKTLYFWFWPVLADLSANRFANRFDVTHMSLEKTEDICSTDFLGIGQKIDNFEKW